MSATIFDIIIIISLLGNTISGYITGFVVQFTRIFSLVAAFWAMSEWTDYLAPRLYFVESQSWRTIAAAVIIFFATLLVMGVLAKILKKILVFSHAGWLDKICGALTAFGVGLIIWTLIFMVLEYLFPKAEFVQSSQLLPYFNRIIELLQQWLPQDFLKLPA